MIREKLKIFDLRIFGGLLVGRTLNAVIRTRKGMDSMEIHYYCRRYLKSEAFSISFTTKIEAQTRMRLSWPDVA